MLAAKENSTFFYVGIIAEKMFRSIEKRYIRSGTVLRWTRPGDHAAPATTTPDNWNADPVNTPVETVPTHPCPRSVDAQPSAYPTEKLHRTNPHFSIFVEILIVFSIITKSYTTNISVTLIIIYSDIFWNLSKLLLFRICAAEFD